MTAPLPPAAAAGVCRQRIDEMTSPPVVGQRYLVPTILYEWSGHRSEWPVMGPKHEDPDLKFPWPHYHVDARFLTDRQVKVMRGSYRGRAADLGFTVDALALAVASAPIHRPSRVHKSKPMPAPVYRDRTCASDRHAYPLLRSLDVPVFGQIHTAYAGRRCARNAAGLLICPHKGFALDTLVPDDEGRVVCPLHGLVIDVAEGVVVAARSPDPRSAPAKDGGGGHA